MEGLFAPLGPRTLHICVDMQRLFSSEGPWATPWMEGVLPQVCRLAEHVADETVFTRFIPPEIPTSCRACGGAISGAGAR